MRLIDADELPRTPYIGDDGETHYSVTVEDIERAPTIPDGRRKADWAKIKYLDAWTCSECGHITSHRSKYCPNCGFPMLSGEI